MSLRDLPAMRRFLEEPDVAGYAALFGTTVVKTVVDDVLRDVRTRVARDEGEVPGFDVMLARVRARLAREENDGLVEVLNGTGILLHTNLGRAPLAPEALAAMSAVAGGYSNLEFDLARGTRGSRYARVSSLLRATTGAQDALVVNNCAAAILLVLDTFARSTVSGKPGREVVVSRNQLVEIGGGFRLPDVLRRSGATLVEVGTTNKVYLRDFEHALGIETALLMRSHTSNYSIEGFVSDVAAADLAALGKRVGVPTVEDLGSGVLVDLVPYGLPHERTVGEVVADGIDLVVFSGDKLLGGPQAGIIVGTSSAIARMRANPLLRALRVDKATLAALGATLRLYLQPGGHERIPFYAMLRQSQADLRTRVRAFIAALDRTDDGRVTGIETLAFAGGGAAPTATVPSYALALRDERTNPNAFAARLREREPRVIARVDGDAALVDFRTIPPEREPDLKRAIDAALA
ncbi:MAG: L-seryl-tRNA(Sec) selenium transferase [Vulcanimicrobiaceae bacterium]